MKVVVGIDAAWTTLQPSGLALVVKQTGTWRLIAVETSYIRYQAIGAGLRTSAAKPIGSAPDVAAILHASAALAQAEVDLVAVDMPLSFSPIEKRRVSDNAVSSAYGARHCATHSPSNIRPGALSDAMRNDFQAAGYPLLTTGIIERGLIEVYPHPALVELAQATERLPYKLGKARKYWPLLSPRERRLALFKQWAKIIGLLENRIAGVANAMPLLSDNAAAWELKAYEDALDAVVCAWVGAEVLEGRGHPYGDRDSAIWIPAPPSR